MAIEDILLKLEDLRKSTSDVSLEANLVKLQHKILKQMLDEWNVE